MLSFKKYKFPDFVEINPPVKLKAGVEYSFIEMADLTDGQRYVYPSKTRTLTGGARFEERDTLFARITPCLENGKICQAKGLKEKKGFGSTEFLVFRGKEGISDSDFVFYLSRWDDVRRFAELNMVGTSGRQRVPKDVFENLELELPLDLPVQTRIAYILSGLDDKIELNRRTNATLEAMAQTLFKKYFVDDIDPDNLPEGWRWGKIGDLIRIQNGFAFKSTDFKEEGDCGIIKIKNINNNVVDIHVTQFVSSSIVMKIDAKFKVITEDVLIAMTGAEVGKIGLVPKTGKNIWLNQRVGKFNEVIKFGKLFCYFQLISDAYQSELQTTAMGSAQPNISASDIENIETILPKASSIQEFGELVEPLFKQVCFNHSEDYSLKLIRDSLLPKLMSGEIEVSAAEQELVNA